MFETETVGPFFVWNLKWGRGGAWPPWPLSGYDPGNSYIWVICYALQMALNKP